MGRTFRLDKPKIRGTMGCFKHTVDETDDAIAITGDSDLSDLSLPLIVAPDDVG